MALFNLFKKKPAIPENDWVIEDERLANYPEMLTFKLLFEDEPILDSEKISTEARKYFTNFDYSNLDNALRFIFPDFQLKLLDATGPAQCLVGVNETMALPEASSNFN